MSVILPISPSCSLIANTKSPADVDKFSTVPISSCSSLTADTKSVVITNTALPLAASLFNSTVCKTESSFKDNELTFTASTLKSPGAYPKTLISELALNVPLLFFVLIEDVLA